MEGHTGLTLTQSNTFELDELEHQKGPDQPVGRKSLNTSTSLSKQPIHSKIPNYIFMVR